MLRRQRTLPHARRRQGLDSFDPFYAEAAKRRNLAGALAAPDFRLVEGDIRDPDALDRALAGADCDAVVHLAALAGVRPSLERPDVYADVNVTGTARVAAAMGRHGVPHLVFASSSSVYGERSGGPFRESSAEEMRSATPAQAVAHPKWEMGAKISVDSATLMNKGLELIEAHYLFGLPSERIDVLVHPQSVVHSLVEFVDGSVLGQLGSPDMRIPIAYALAWPERIGTPANRLDLAAIARLEFEAPDVDRFPALRLARQTLEAGGAAPIVLNAANEVAVASFLDGRIGFTEIAAIVEHTLGQVHATAPSSIDDVLEIDRTARQCVEAEMKAVCQ